MKLRHSAYIRAAKRIASGEESYCCIAIQESLGMKRDSKSPEQDLFVKAFMDGKYLSTFFGKLSANYNWSIADEDRYHKWNSSRTYSDGMGAIQEMRVLALLLIAEAVKAGDLKPGDFN